MDWSSFIGKELSSLLGRDDIEARKKMYVRSSDRIGKNEFVDFLRSNLDAFCDLSLDHRQVWKLFRIVMYSIFEMAVMGGRGGLSLRNIGSFFIKISNRTGRRKLVFRASPVVAKVVDDLPVLARVYDSDGKQKRDEDGNLLYRVVEEPYNGNSFIDFIIDDS